MTPFVKCLEKLWPSTMGVAVGAVVHNVPPVLATFVEKGGERPLVFTQYLPLPAGVNLSEVPRHE